MSKDAPLTEQDADSIAASVVDQIFESKPPEQDTCKNCIAFRWHKDEGRGVGRCHRFPPTALGVNFSTSNAAWPVVEPNTGWCREHVKIQ